MNTATGYSVEGKELAELFHNKKKLYRNNVKHLGMLENYLSSVTHKKSLSSSYRNDYFSYFEKGKDLTPASLYFLAQVKGVDLTVFNSKQLYTLALLCSHIEHIVTTRSSDSKDSDSKLFSYINRKRTTIDYLSTSSTMYAHAMRIEKSKKTAYKIFYQQDSKAIANLKNIICSFYFIYTESYNLCLQQLSDSKDKDMSGLINIMRFLTTNKVFFNLENEVVFSPNSTGYNECNCSQCAQCVQVYAERCVKFLNELSGLEVFADKESYRTNNLNGVSAEIMLYENVYNFKVLNYVEDAHYPIREKMNNTGFSRQAHLRNLWSYKNTYLAQKEFNEIILS